MRKNSKVAIEIHYKSYSFCLNVVISAIEGFCNVQENKYTIIYGITLPFGCLTIENLAISFCWREQSLTQIEICQGLNQIFGIFLYCIFT